MKKLVSALLVVCMLLIEATSFALSTTYAAGTYEASGKGHGGEVAVRVTFSENAILNIEVVSHNETPSICDVAMERIPQEIVSQQSLAVDVISGATESSNAILSAVASCVKLANGNVDELLAKRNTQTAVNEEVEADIVVVGAGFAGLTAAVEAADRGLKVVLIEKLSDVGGSSKMSSGKFPAPQSGDIQDGVISTVEGFVDAWMARTENMADQSLVSMVNENAEETFSWLADHGALFTPAVTSFTGYKLSNYSAAGETGRGGDVTTPLYQHLLTLENVSIYLDTSAKTLNLQEGIITGVKSIKKDGGELVVNAKAVILATGGYDQNPEMLAMYSPIAAGDASLSSIGNTGDGLRMAMEVGADTVFHNGVIGTAIIGGKKERGASNLMLNLQAERFANENEYYPDGYRTRKAEGSAYCWDIFDISGYKDKYAAYIANGDGFTANSLEELAALIGLDEQKMLTSIARYNELCALGTDQDFGKDSSKMVAIVKAPFYAMRVDNGSFGSLGGIKINEKCEVLGTDGNTIKGLYAAGEIANGELNGVSVPWSGAPLTQAVVLGRQAGIHASEFVVQQ